MHQCVGYLGPGTGTGFHLTWLAEPKGTEVELGRQVGDRWGQRCPAALGAPEMPQYHTQSPGGARDHGILRTETTCLTGI